MNRRVVRSCSALAFMSLAFVVNPLWFTACFENKELKRAPFSYTSQQMLDELRSYPTTYSAPTAEGSGVLEVTYSIDGLNSSVNVDASKRLFDFRVFGETVSSCGKTVARNFMLSASACLGKKAHERGPYESNMGLSGTLTMTHTDASGVTRVLVDAEPFDQGLFNVQGLDIKDGTKLYIVGEVGQGEPSRRFSLMAKKSSATIALFQPAEDGLEAKVEYSTDAHILVDVAPPERDYVRSYSGAL